MRSTQAPLQLVCPVRQAHVPPLQACPPVHTTPQPPQLLGSLSVGTHVPLQFVWLAPHWHVPSRQVSTPVHACPHDPQFNGSRPRFAHTPLPQSVVLPVQLDAH
jgi:hypothetical protein